MTVTLSAAPLSRVLFGGLALLVRALLATEPWEIVQHGWFALSATVLNDWKLVRAPVLIPFVPLPVGWVI